jgi:signal transduction protein with GAF and PtsI domain
LEQLERVIDYDSASIFIEENGRLTLVAAKGFKDNRKLIGATLPPDPKLFTRQVLESRTPMLLANVQEHPGWAHHADLPGSDSVQGWIGAPLVLRDQAVGVLSVDSRRANAFTPKDLQVVSAFADHAAAAVANAQLFDASQRQLVATQALAEAARAVTATLNLDEVLQRILSETMRSLQSEAASLALLADSSGALEFRNALGMGAEKVRACAWRRGRASPAGGGARCPGGPGRTPTRVSSAWTRNCRPRPGRLPPLPSACRSASSGCWRPSILGRPSSAKCSWSCCAVSPAWPARPSPTPSCSARPRRPGCAMPAV